MATSKFSWRSLFITIAYIAVILVGLALALEFVLAQIGVQASLVGMVRQLADAIAYILLAIFSYSYVRSRRHIAYLIIWIISVVMIVVFFIL